MTFRTLTVAGQVWSYYIGKTRLVLCAPNGKKKAIRLDDLTGRSSPIFERGKWKKTSDGMVLPAHVRAYVERAEMRALAQRTVARRHKPSFVRKPPHLLEIR